MYSISPIFIIYPILLLVLSVFKKNKLIAILASLLFFVLYTFSKNGSDYYNYEGIYNRIARGDNILDVHGEIGFKLLMKGFALLHCPYHLFRVVMLMCVTSVLFIYIYKFSPNYCFSVFILCSLFVIYTISTYRQFIVMAFSFMLIFWYNIRGKKYSSIIGAAVLMLFHVSAILLLLYFLMDFIIGSLKDINKGRNQFFRVAILLCFCAMLMRVILVQLFKIDALRNLSIKILGETPDENVINSGVMSRLVATVALVFVYNRSRENKTIAFVLFYYCVGMLIYIALPYEYVLGRLMNNAKIFEVILIPMVYANYKETTFAGAFNFYLFQQQKEKRFIQTAYVTGFICLCILILLNQLVNQDGYYPYVNPLFGFI